MARVSLESSISSYHHPVFTYMMMMFAFLIGALIGITAAVIATDSDRYLMPCAKGEVYVWSNYPDKARCVDSEDYKGHST